jgi:hypothetical protein
MTDRTRAIDAVAQLRPQRFGTGHHRRIADPVVEPLWTGLRALAAVDGEAAVIRDEEGEPFDSRPEVLEALVDASRAESLVLDGYVTKEMAGDGTGTDTGPEGTPSTARLIGQSLIGSRRNRAQEAAERLERLREARTFAPGEAVIYVATDLLWLDGESLLDVPLLERKRLLENVLSESDRVRRGAYVRPPIDTWVGSWRSLGFVGLSFKGVNSRYRPGEQTNEWATAAMPRR